MSLLKKLDVYAAGLAIFAMFFGAGNLIYPLALGYQTLDKTWYAISGLLLTAVIVPFSGLVAMFLYQGNTKAFFNRIGETPGLLLAFFIIALLGPLGSTPRCIALAYSTFKVSFPYLSVSLFSGISCLLIFFLTYKKNRLLGILGYILTPALMMLLIWIIIRGLQLAPMFPSQTLVQSELAAFWHGLKEGYNTMDLLAAFFFAPVVLASFAKGSAKPSLSFILQASGIGAFLLALVYIGFSYLASYYAFQIGEVSSEQLLSAIVMQILGPEASVIIGLVVVLACLTTAMALMAAFTGFIQQEILKAKDNYTAILACSLAVTFFVATFEFQGISALLNPVLKICYPTLILLTAYNLYCFQLKAGI